MQNNYYPNSSLYGAHLNPYGEDHQNDYILSAPALSSKSNSIQSLENQTMVQDSMQEVPFEAFPDNEKVLIPGKLPGEPPMLVNAKQARRILIMRQKKCKKMLKMMEEGMYVNPHSIMSSSSTKARKKDQVRQKVALARKRVNGLFVTKR